MTLPDHAARKLALLTQQCEDAKALAVSAKAQTEVLQSKVVQLHNAHAPAVEINKAMDEAERAQDLMVSRRRVWDEREQLLARVRSWISELPRTTVLETMPAPSISMNGPPQQIVHTLRSELGKLAAEFHQITAAGPTRDDARAQINSLVQSLAVQGRPRADVQRGEVRVSGWMGDGAGYPVAHSITLQFMAWLDPDRMIARLNEMLEAVPVDAHALPLDQRKERLHEIEGEIAILEHREEHMIMHVASEGVIIERRHDASPSAILGVQIAKPATARVAA